MIRPAFPVWNGCFVNETGVSANCAIRNLPVAYLLFAFMSLDFYLAPRLGVAQVLQ